MKLVGCEDRSYPLRTIFCASLAKVLLLRFSELGDDAFGVLGGSDSYLGWTLAHGGTGDGEQTI